MASLAQALRRATPSAAAERRHSAGNNMAIRWVGTPAIWKASRSQQETGEARPRSAQLSGVHGCLGSSTFAGPRALPSKMNPKGRNARAFRVWTFFPVPALMLEQACFASQVGNAGSNHP